MTSPIAIRRADFADVDRLAPLFDAYRQFYDQPSDVVAARGFLADRLILNESVIYLAVGAENNGVGFTQLYPSFSSVSLCSIWILNDLYVSESSRRLGIARLLVEAARHFASQTGARRIILSTAHTNSSARQLYELLGFQREDLFANYELEL